ncbi:type VI secretion system contractile sheath large subunit [Oceanobacter mangrovi]|uniref:type VI secretion system contractile sheath large subunit n=1 Tax=Oceanobacter mangrovi TaxID=2862510 RepID=UPI001C8D305B|nr:type VI secretion system contractile sheath large subunit [Oceanobacter mangrovi]
MSNLRQPDGNTAIACLEPVELPQARNAVRQPAAVPMAESHTDKAVDSAWLQKLALRTRSEDSGQLQYLLQRMMVEIEERVARQLDEIIHHERFKALEASWRGLLYLVETEADYDEELMVKIRVMDISWEDAARDLGRAIEFDQSYLFQRIYSDEFDTPGGEPFGVLLGDYRVSHKTRRTSSMADVDVLREMSQIATAALCPFLVGVDSSLFGLDSMSELANIADYHDVFEQTEYLRWRSLRQMESTRFVGLVMPDVLMRQPWQPDETRPDPLPYREGIHRGVSDYLWGNACYAMGGVLIRAFANNGWFADIRGGTHEFGEGGIVRQMVYGDYAERREDVARKPATIVQIDDYLERDLSELGFVPLCSYHSSEVSVFYSNSSLHQPPRMNTEIANTNARMSAMIQYMMCVARFGHYIKMIGRNKVGSYISASDCQRILQNWLNQYTTASEGSSPALKARYPLSESRVEVREAPGKQGHFTCVIYLKPHFQLDQLVSSIKLVTELAVGSVDSGG